MIREYFLLEPSNRKDVTRATLAKIAFFSIDSKDSTQIFKDGAQTLKDLDKEQERIEQERIEGFGGAPTAPARTRTASFVPPTVDEVDEYVRSYGGRVVAQVWVDFYAARGWMMGKIIMKDWKAAVRNAETWERWQKPSGKSDVKTPSDYESGESFV